MPARLFRSLRKPVSFIFSVALIIGFAPALLAEDAKRNGNPRRTPVVEVVERNKAAVVNIHSERTVSLDNRERQPNLAQIQQRVNGMGTGVVIDPRGYIITNHHVVDDVQTLRVRLHDGTTLPARVVAKEPSEDLAVIKVDPSCALPTVAFGTASDLIVGEPVIAIGNAYGYEHTVTTGVVSAVNRDVTLNRDVSYKSLIQTDACINPGNSGGPLFNIHGELIGVNVAIRAGAQGIAFAIPVDTALRVGAELISCRRRVGIAHGLAVRDVVDVSESSTRRWAVVERVEANTAADKAGLRPGDVIERVGDIKVACGLDLERAFLDRPQGDKLRIEARRGVKAKGEGGETVRGELILRGAERASVPPAPNDLIWKKLGIRVQQVPAEQVIAVNPQLHGGLLITEIQPEGAAARAGFQRGDILIGLHQWETISTDNVLYVLNHQDLAAFSPLRFFRLRAGQLQRGWLPNLD